MSPDFGTLENGTWIMSQGWMDTDTGDVFPRINLIGGMISMKLNRERKMFFGSWTGNPIPEAAVANIGDSTGITAATVTPATFGSKVGGLSGEYVFSYDGTEWTLNGNPVALTGSTNSYGVTLTGDPVNGDIVVVTYTAAAGAWEALGKDNDDLSKELNPDTETSKNVLGETTFTHSGYEPEIGVDPYYIDPSRKMYKHLADIATQEKYSDADTLGYFAEAEFTTANPITKVMTGYAYVRRAHFVPQSVGGDTAGYRIPVTITPVGTMTKKKIVYDMATNEATITDIA